MEPPTGKAGGDKERGVRAACPRHLLSRCDELGELPLYRLRRMTMPSALQPAAKGCLTRRSFFSQVAGGLYGTALTYLLTRDLYGAPLTAEARTPLPFDLQPRAPHFPARAKAV